MDQALHEEDIRILVEEVKAQKKLAQLRLFQMFGDKMLSICRYYISDLQNAEDVMIVGFHKVFTHLHTYRGEGSLEGWMRKLMTREAISYLRKRKTILFVDEIIVQEEEDSVLDDPIQDYTIEAIQTIIDELPEGYKTVFLLYVLEDYSHKEIAGMLNISESTSKTQLFKAKRMMKTKFESLKKKKNG